MAGGGSLFSGLHAQQMTPSIMENTAFRLITGVYRSAKETPGECTVFCSPRLSHIYCYKM